MTCRYVCKGEKKYGSRSNYKSDQLAWSSSPMKYAFPGNVALDVIDTDCDGTEKDVCRMTEK